VRTDAETGRVSDWRYKSDEPFGTTAAAEVFAYDARALFDALDALAAMVEANDEMNHLGDFGHHLVPALVEEGRAYAVAHQGYWRDVGTVASYWEGHMDLLRDGMTAPGGPLDLDNPEWPLRTAATQRLPAHLTRSAQVDDALVSPGAAVAGRVERSVLGPGVVVEEGAEVRDSVLLDHVVVRRGARVTRAVLDERVEVGEGAAVGADVGAQCVLGQRVRVDAGAVLAPGTERDAEGVTSPGRGAARA